MTLPRLPTTPVVRRIEVRDYGANLTEGVYVLWDIPRSARGWPGEAR